MNYIQCWLIACPFFMIRGLSATAQEIVTDEYHFKKAEAFKKAALNDSAVYYFKKAATVFTMADNTEGMLSAYNQLGTLLTRLDKYEEARFYLQAAMQVGDSSPRYLLHLATTYINLGVIYGAEKKYSESLKFHNQSLAIRQRLLGNNSAEVATNYGNIGNVYFKMKEPGKAIEFHDKARQIREKIFGEHSVEVIESYANLGNAYTESKQYPEAIKYYKQALANKILQRGEGHKDLGRLYNNLSAVYYAIGDKPQGDSFAQKAAGVSAQ